MQTVQTIEEFVKAVESGDERRVRAMLDADPALVEQCHEGATPLHLAAIGNGTGVVDVLIERGADLDARDDEFRATPLGWANEGGRTSMVRHLVERGARVDLHQAAAYGLIDHVCRLLRQHPGRVDLQDGFGTPLHQAALWGHADIVELLLRHGANPDLRARDGRTALQIALRQIRSDAIDTPIVSPARRRQIVQGCRHCVELLRAHGASD